MNTLIPIDEARLLADNMLQKHGYSKKESQIIGDILLFGSLRESSQGLNKLFGWHAKKDPNSEEPEIVKVTSSVSLCNAHRNSGMYANFLATKDLLKQVRKQGLFLVGVNNFSSSSGQLCYYTKMISKEGYVGLMFASADPIGGIAPKGRRVGVFGTNPLSISIPYDDRDITLDMSTAKYTWGDLVKADIKAESLEPGFAFDDNGQPTIEPKKAMNGSVAAFDGSYKGIGLAFMIQILAGALVGSVYEQSDETCDYGSLIIAIDPKRLGGLEFMQEQVKKMISAFKIKSGSEKNFLPGEQGDSRYEVNLNNKTVTLDAELYNKITKELDQKF